MSNTVTNPIAGQDFSAQDAVYLSGVKITDRSRAAEVQRAVRKQIGWKKAIVSGPVGGPWVVEKNDRHRLRGPITVVLS